MSKPALRVFLAVLVIALGFALWRMSRDHTGGGYTPPKWVPGSGNG